MIFETDVHDASKHTAKGRWEVLCLDERRVVWERWNQQERKTEAVTTIYPPGYVITSHRTKETADKHVAKCMKYPKSNKGLRFLARRKV